MNMKISIHEPFKALGEPGRLRVVVLLLKGELCVCDLTAALELPQPTISRYMATLKAAGLVTDRREGRWIHYRLTDTEPLTCLRDYLQSLAEQAPFAEDRLRLTMNRKSTAC